MILDVISSLAGLILPPAVDFIKKRFLKKGQDTPEATLSTLATTKPEVMPAYMEALAKMYGAKTNYFNRDRVGNVSVWVDNLRASIRPIFVIISLAMKILSMKYNFVLGSFRFLMEACISSWFGSRLTGGE